LDGNESHTSNTSSFMEAFKRNRGISTNNSNNERENHKALITSNNSLNKKKPGFKSVAKKVENPNGILVVKSEVKFKNPHGVHFETKSLSKLNLKGLMKSSKKILKLQKTPSKGKLIGKSKDGIKLSRTIKNQIRQTMSKNYTSVVHSKQKM